MTRRLFWGFKPHDAGTFVAWDGTKRIVYRSDQADGREVSVMMQTEANHRLDKGAYTPGMPVRLQFGEASRSTSQMNGGTRQVVYPKYGGGVRIKRIDGYVGRHCVTAMAHARPRINLLSVHAMLDQFGVQDTLRHLQNFADGASSLQTEINLERWKGERGASSFSIEKGLLGMHRRFSDDVWIRNGTLNFSAQLPESVQLALPGRPLSTVLDHAVTRDPALVIAHLQVNGDRMAARTDQVVTAEEAIAIVRALETPLAKAA